MAGHAVGLGRGAAAPLRGWGFVWRHPSTWWLCALPVLINAAIFAAGFWLAYDRLNRLLTSLLPQGQAWWWTALLYLALVVVVLALAMVGVLLFTAVGRIIAAPFLELLTRRVERLAAGDAARQQWAEAGLLAEVWRVAKQEAKKLLLYLLVMAPIWLASFVIPGVGATAASVLAWLVTAYFLSLEFLDYPLDRRGLSLGQKMGYTWRLGGGWLGFGAASFILGVLPVLNLALVPLCAVGGTLLYLDRPLTPAARA